MRLPQWKCHKVVEAVKIKSVEQQWACANREANMICGEPMGAHTREAAKLDVGMDHSFITGTFKVWAIVPVEGDPFMVNDTYTTKHNPLPDGYYVRYEDGYESFSPTKAFEEGYTRLVFRVVPNDRVLGEGGEITMEDFPTRELAQAEIDREKLYDTHHVEEGSVEDEEITTV